MCHQFHPSWGCDRDLSTIEKQENFMKSSWWCSQTGCQVGRRKDERI